MHKRETGMLASSRWQNAGAAHWLVVRVQLAPTRPTHTAWKRLQPRWLGKELIREAGPMPDPPHRVHSAEVQSGVMIGHGGHVLSRSGDSEAPIGCETSTMWVVGTPGQVVYEACIFGMDVGASPQITHVRLQLASNPDIKLGPGRLRIRRASSGQAAGP